MKKILFVASMLALLFTACDPSVDDKSASGDISSADLTSGFTITAESEGNNNLTIFTSPSRFIKVYDSTTGDLLGSGTMVKCQVTPPATAPSFYITTANQDGTITKSDVKSIAVSEYTKLPAMFQKFFADGNGGYGVSSKWTWDDTADFVWGTGGNLESTSPGWFKVSAAQIDDEAVKRNLSGEGAGAWFKLSASGCSMSSGAAGRVKITDDVVKDGWDIGKMVFTGMTPPLGILSDKGNVRAYEYLILKADGTHLNLCVPYPGAGDWGEAQFWCFKKDEPQ